MGNPKDRYVMSSGVCKNKGTDKPVHLHSLISAFVIHLLESSISICHGILVYILASTLYKFATLFTLIVFLKDFF